MNCCQNGFRNTLELFFLSLNLLLIFFAVYRNPFHLREQHSEAYLRPCQISMMALFAKIVAISF